MAGDDRPKPAIPAWQRAQQPLAEQPGQDETEETNTEETKTEETAKSSEVQDAAWQRASPVESLESVTEKSTSPQPSSQSSEPSNPSLSTSDFETFQRQQNITTTSSPQPSTRPSGPPIITYPEFLVEAHKPPPLITPERIWNTAYIISGVTAVLYGASKYLVGPMSDSLNGARHDFAMHSLSKVDELNERLSKLVSKLPESGSDAAVGGSVYGDETESVASDPAELYHRNIGTQTSPISSRENSMLAGTRPTSAGDKNASTASDRQIAGLNILKDHLSDMVERSENLATANKARQEKMDSLLAYLDTTIYASPYVSSWATADQFVSSKDAEGDDSKDDAVDGLKKEIRAIKGLMLSAKRFPGVAGRVPGST